MNPLRSAVVGAGALLLAAALPAQWNPVTTTGTPAPRDGAWLGYELSTGRMLLFGGNATNDFYALQNGAWTRLLPTNLPSPRREAGLSAGLASGGVLLYGGDDGAGRLANDETWWWNGTDWTLLAAGSAIGGLSGHSMAEDPLRQTTVLFGGRHDSWAPALLSSLTWEFQNGAWQAVSTSIAPPPRRRAAAAFHPALSAVLLFGGEDGQGLALDDTWSFDGANWTQRNTAGARPSARSGAVLVSRPGHGDCLLCGGWDPWTATIANDTWTHDGVAWNVVPGVYTGIYPARRGAGIALDLARDRLVAFGGTIANNSLRDDTWEYGAAVRPFGLSCAGSAGAPGLTAVAPPVLGGTCTMRLSNLPPASSAAFLAVGLSRTQWAFGPLPTLLDGFGLTGCRGYTSAEVFVLLPAAAGIATWSWTVPSQPVWFGQEFHLQGVGIEPGRNPAGLITTNAATLVLGG